MALPTYSWNDYTTDEFDDTKHSLAILRDGDVIAEVVHRSSFEFPLHSADAAHKRLAAGQIVTALNAKAVSDAGPNPAAPFVVDSSLSADEVEFGLLWWDEDVYGSTDEIPGLYYLTITHWGEEIATVFHTDTPDLVNGPEGPEADAKVADATYIVAALTEMAAKVAVIKDDLAAAGVDVRPNWLGGPIPLANVVAAFKG